MISVLRSKGKCKVNLELHVWLSGIILSPYFEAIIVLASSTTVFKFENYVGLQMTFLPRSTSGPILQIPSDGINIPRFNELAGR